MRQGPLAAPLADEALNDQGLKIPPQEPQILLQPVSDLARFESELREGPLSVLPCMDWILGVIRHECWCGPLGADEEPRRVVAELIDTIRGIAHPARQIGVDAPKGAVDARREVPQLEQHAVGPVQHDSDLGPADSLIGERLQTCLRHVHADLMPGLEVARQLLSPLPAVPFPPSAYHRLPFET